MRTVTASAFQAGNLFTGLSVTRVISLVGDTWQQNLMSRMLMLRGDSTTGLMQEVNMLKLNPLIGSTDQGQQIRFWLEAE